MILVMDAQMLDSFIYQSIQKSDFLIVSFSFHSLAREILQGGATLRPLFVYSWVQLVEKRQDPGLIIPSQDSEFVASSPEGVQSAQIMSLLKFQMSHLEPLQVGF